MNLLLSFKCLPFNFSFKIYIKLTDLSFLASKTRKRKKNCVELTTSGFILGEECPFSFIVHCQFLILRIVSSFPFCFILTFVYCRSQNGVRKKTAETFFPSFCAEQNYLLIVIFGFSHSIN